MKHLVLLPLVLGLISTPSALALSAKTISSEQAQGTTGIVTLEVAPGYGLNINLIPTGEVVKKAWIDDPSQIVLSFDGNLCQPSDDSECNNEGATVIHLRQIKPIAFPNLPRSPGGGTLLTLITEGNEGRKIYQFKVVPTKSQPKYTVLSISPEVEQPTQVIPPALPGRSLPIVQAPEPTSDTVNAPQWQAQTPVTANSANNTPTVVSLPPASKSPLQAVDSQQVTPTPNQNPTTPTDEVTAIPEAIAVPKVTPSVAPTRPSANEIASDKQPSPNADKMETSTRTTPPPTSANNIDSDNNSITQANALVRGLTIARQKGQINFETTTWKKVQSVVRLLRRGATPQSAAQEVEISLQLINQLLAWGQGSTVANRNK